MKSNRWLSTANVLLLSLVLFYMPSLLFQIEQGDEVWEWDTMGMVHSTFYTLAFMVNYFWLVPSCLIRKSKLSVYLLVNFAMIVATMLLIPLWAASHGELPKPPTPMGDSPTVWRYIAVYAGFSIRDGIMVILSAAFAYAIRIGREKEIIRERELEINAERREIELQSLKAQLNPHFLFNSLNNIYALIEFAPDRAKEALHALSNMLRFMIHDSSNLVDINREARFIHEYVELMKLRIGSVCKMEYEFSPTLPQEARIAPLLYITLVENAFKHCSSNGKDYFIRVKLWEDTNEKEEKICFRVENTFSEDEEDKNKTAGVGLQNVRRQLNLLYPGECQFEIDMSKGVYIATVKIDLKALTAKVGTIKEDTKH